MANPTISVLMPVFNTSPHILCESITSILEQTFVDFEFLILNDSPENTEIDKVIKSFTDRRIVFMKNAKNLGISASRNILLSESKGKYIAVMDHDDISLPSRFEKQINILENDPSIGVVSCNVYFFNQNKTLVYPQNDIDIKMDLISGICVILHPASMIRKCILTQNNIFYEEEYTPSEDFQLWHRLIKYTQFYNIQETLFKYRDFENNTSKKMINRMKTATQMIIKRSKVENHDQFRLFEKNELRWHWLIIAFRLNIITIHTTEFEMEIKLFGRYKIGRIKKKHNSFYYAKGML